MLLNLNKTNWSKSVRCLDYKDQQERSESTLKEMARLTESYNKWIQEEIKKTKEELVVTQVGKMNPKVHLANHIEELMNENVTECLGTMINTVVF